VSILAHHLTGFEEDQEEDFEFVAQFEGGYNHVRIYKLFSGVDAGTYVVKVPSVGTTARWQPKDAYMLRSEYGMMKLIHERTQCPVPEVIAFDDTLTNDLGTPFIIMRACSNVKASDLCFGSTLEGNDDAVNVDHFTEEISEKCKTLLESLARAIAELGTLESNHIGALDFDLADEDGDLVVGPTYQWKIDGDTTEEDLTTDSVILEHPVHKSSREYFISGLRDANSYKATSAGRVKATHHLLVAVYSSEPFNASLKHGDANETFVLRHDDLNFQNIFCDPDTGEVTGIINWERASTAPRCIGYATLPVFFTTDHCPNYSLFFEAHTTWALEEYRRLYADAMIEATGSEGDGKYTFKSGLYQAAHGALYGSAARGSCRDFLHKLLRSIQVLDYLNIDEFLDWMGEDGFDWGMEMAGRELPGILAP
jgi:aminoglycoside phosphotransferase (APT) family kinase protein